jgi:hypothetical protein
VPLAPVFPVRRERIFRPRRILLRLPTLPYPPRTSMPDEEPQTFADRLPPVVPREEADIAHLTDEMADVLYPGRRPRPFRMGLVFAEPAGAGAARALALARQADVYAEQPGGRPGRGGPWHRAEFGSSSAAALRELFSLVGEQAGTEVLVDGRRVPNARELWLPLYWILVRH